LYTTGWGDEVRTGPDCAGRLTEQVAVSPTPESVHGLVAKVPLPSMIQLTVPLGVLVPAERITDATQVMLSP